MEWFKELFGFLAAALAVITVVVQYLASKDRTTTPSSSPLVALNVAKDRRARFSETKMRSTNRVLLWLLYGAAAWLTLLIWFAYQGFKLSTQEDNVSFILGVGALLVSFFAYFMLFMYIYPLYTLARARFKGPPWVRRQAEATVVGTDIQAVQDQCIVALRKMRATIVEIDSTKGVIEALIVPGRFWATLLVDYLTISITRLDDKNSVQITIISDGVRPSFGVDGTRNASNVNRFIDHLVG